MVAEVGFDVYPSHPPAEEEVVKKLTSEQFDALAELLRLRAGLARDVARLVLVKGMGTPDAARAAGLGYPLALRSVKRARAGLALAKIAAGAGQGAGA